MSIETYGRWPWGAAAMVGPAWALALTQRKRLTEDGAWVGALAVPILVTHQTEEWVRPGGFLPFSNQRLLGSARPTWPLTERIGFHVNVSLGWTTALAAAALWRPAPAIAAGVLGLEASNALMHAGMAIRERGYNPGVVSAGLMAVHAAAGAAWLRGSGRLSRGAGLAAAGVAAAATAALPISLRARMRRAAAGR